MVLGFLKGVVGLGCGSLQGLGFQAFRTCRVRVQCLGGCRLVLFRAYRLIGFRVWCVGVVGLRGSWLVRAN